MSPEIDDLADDLPGELPDEIEEVDAPDEGEDDGSGDEGESQDDVADEGQEEDLVDEPPPRRKPVSQVVRESKNARKESDRIAREASDKADRLERELNEIRAQRNQPSQADLERMQREEEARLAVMTPDERIDYRFRQQDQRFNQALQTERVTQAQRTDASAFKLRQQTDPLARKYAAEVEKLVDTALKNGQLLERNTALTFVLGQEFEKRGPAALAKESKAAKARVDGAKGKPGRAAGDLSRDRGARREGGFDEASFERRFGNVKF